MAFVWCKEPAFIYTHIPKTGGTSLFSHRSKLTKQLKKICPDISVMGGHRYLRYYKGKIPDFDNYLRFATVRNPYDRFVSLWLTKNKDMPFIDFVNLVRENKLAWYQLKSQSAWISTIDGKILTNHLLRFENYEPEVRRLFIKLGLPDPKIPHLRKTERRKNYRHYYTDEIVDFVTDYYSVDLENFNYSY